MKARQAVAEVNKVVANCNVSEDVESTFERWEAVILENETIINGFSTSYSPLDPLETEYRTEEERLELELQLEALITKEKEEE